MWCFVVWPEYALRGCVGYASALLQAAAGRITHRRTRRWIFVQATIIPLAARRFDHAPAEWAAGAFVFATGEGKVANVCIITHEEAASFGHVAARPGAFSARDDAAATSNLSKQTLMSHLLCV